jgi:hypothetical protein
MSPAGYGLLAWFTEGGFFTAVRAEAGRVYKVNSTIRLVSCAVQRFTIWKSKHTQGYALVKGTSPSVKVDITRSFMCATAIRPPV